MPKNPLENAGEEKKIIKLTEFRKEKERREGNSKPSAKRILAYLLIVLLGNAALVMSLSDYYRSKVLNLLGMQSRSSDRLNGNDFDLDELELSGLLNENREAFSEEIQKEASAEALKIADEQIKDFNSYLTVLFKKRDGIKLTPEEEKQWKEFTYYFPYHQKDIAKLKEILSQFPSSEIPPFEIEQKVLREIALFSIIEPLYNQIKSVAVVSSEIEK